MNHHTINVGNGNVHVFANETVFNQIESEVFVNAYHNLNIPNNHFFSYTPDVHPGKGTCVGTTAVWKESNAYISPSMVGSDIGCGMRVHITNLTKDDLQDVSVRRELLSKLETYIPTNKGRDTQFKNIKLENIVNNGLHGLPKSYVPDSYTPKQQTSLSHVESSKFSFQEDALDFVSNRMWGKSHSQLGTIGSSNHFLEIQYITISEENKHLAEKWGLKDGQVTIMIHTGSRAWGGMGSEYFTSKATEYMQSYDLGTGDPNIKFLPFHSGLGTHYYNFLLSALNYAVTNRHLIALAASEAFKDVFGPSFQSTALYDLMHNYALLETHDDTKYLIHRKGATRSLPADHPLVPSPFKETGHPSLIPGSMGTKSYIMVGLEQGDKNFYSICHGAGRKFSRSAAKEVLSIDSFRASMKIGEADEIVMNHTALEHVISEAPEAYKDVDEIVSSIEGAQLAKVVATCTPLIVMKGV
ncbi:RNA ligase RtcB [Bacillus cereus]|uniref:tRNA-splicing ligase RtcB n=1 Tax=Bacillus cereus TaxID=1396 RepID=A0A162PGY6_BACCE|nr:RtcB family protein [Bacillus cereus]KZD71959.1 Protein RtcB [Bacillus cereus]